MKYAALASLSLLALTACSGDTVKDTLGLDRAPPDEFRVVSRPPLYVPPQFSLRPPANTDASPNQLTADQKAQSLMNGTAPTGDVNGSLKPDTAVIPVTASGTPASTKSGKASQSASTGAEAQFLKDVGADKADPKIRDSLTEEKYAVQEKKEDKAWWDIFSLDDDKPDPIVDPKKEAQRIQQNQNVGKPVTEGKTPEIKSGDNGWLGSIFGD